MSMLSSRLRVEMARSRSSLAILVIGIVIAIAAAAEVVSRENVVLPWQSTYTVQIAVSNATGVVPGLDEVRWAGIVVGRITGVHFHGGQPVLTAEMNTGDLGGARLYGDAEVQLRPATPLQDMYLDVISRGQRSAGLLASNQVLDADQTELPVNVADVLNTFSEPVRERLQELLDELGTGLSPAGGQQLRDAFTELLPLLEAQKRLSQTVDTRQLLVKNVIHDSRLLFAELAQRSTQLGKLLQTGASTLGALGSESGPLAETLSELPGTLQQMRSSFTQLDTTLADVRPALSDLVPTANALPAGLKALERFAVDAFPALQALHPAVVSLTPLAEHLAPTASALQAAFAKLLPQAPELNSITAKVVPCELPVDKFFAWTLSLLKFGNADNRTDSPRGTLVTGPFEDPLAKDPTVSPVIGCADSQPAPTSTDQ
jgi:phospholipid/cholesterol/gamma-HCH transport system substrate-binding protein